jgi:cell wall-associated NlpC family hydrolase
LKKNQENQRNEWSGRSVTIATATIAAPAAATAAAATVAAAAATTTVAAPAATTATAAAAATTTVAAAAAAAAATTVATTTTTTAATTEAAAATTTGGALFTGTGNVDGQRTTTQIFAVEHFHSTIGFVCRRELDEGETTRLSSHAIEHQVDISDHTGRRKVILEVTFLRLVGQVSHKQTGIVIHMTFGRSSTE